MRISDYPFSQEASEEVRRTGYSLESLLTKNSFKAVRGRAQERVAGAISGGIRERPSESRAEQLTELLSYPLARVMASCLGDPILLKRYAVAEAKLAHRRMQAEREGLEALASDLGLHPQRSGAAEGPHRIHFTEYIHAAARMHSPKWKLTNRDLSQGYLTITDEELQRIMQEAVSERVQKGLPIKVDEMICTALQEYLEPLQRQLEAMRARDRVDLGRVEAGAFPPCIQRMISDVAKGKNLAHSARFALVSFLLATNMTPEEVISIFNTSPDFDSERTRYQVEHIAGATGTKYRPPACSTMATYGNCPGEDELCRQIRHPLNYYERRMRSIRPPSREREPGRGA